MFATRSGTSLLGDEMNEAIAFDTTEKYPASAEGDLCSDSFEKPGSFLFRPQCGPNFKIWHKKRTKTFVKSLDYKGFCPGIPRGTPIMGEEKPDEELMGKRKSSPRLSTTFGDVDTLIMSGPSRIIHDT